MSVRGSTRKPMRRRALLKGLGASALLLPWLDSPALRGRAHARKLAFERPIDNLLLVTWPCGLEPGWEPRGTGSTYALVGRATTTTSTNALASEPILKDLVGRHRDTLMIVTGLRSGASDPRYIHSQGPPSMWTGWGGAGTDPAAVSPRPSIDQRIAPRFETRRSSLHAGVLVGAREVAPRLGLGNYHFGSSGPVEVKQDPLALYETVIGSFISDRPDIHLRDQQRSVLDFLSADIARLQGHLPSADRVRLDRHLEQIREHERQLFSADCETPQQPDSALGGDGAISGAQGVALTRAQANGIAIAFSCQLTKVATLQLGRSDCMYTVPYEGATSPVHVAAHAGPAGALTRYVSARYMADRLADVLDALARIQYDHGETLLDRTLVVMSSEMGNPNHGLDVPLFIAGGSAGFRRGEAVALKDSPTVSRLLVTLLSRYGFAEDTYGDLPGNSRGVLDVLMG